MALGNSAPPVAGLAAAPAACVHGARAGCLTGLCATAQRLRILYAPPRTVDGVGLATSVAVGPPLFIPSSGAGLVGDAAASSAAVEGRATPRSAPEPERVNDEVEKLLALVRVKRTQV
jgi:hypothetical protein